MSAGVIVDTPVKNVLKSIGWAFVGRSHAKKVQALQDVLDTIYVDTRRKAQVDALEKARKIAKELNRG